MHKAVVYQGMFGVVELDFNTKVIISNDPV